MACILSYDNHHFYDETTFGMKRKKHKRINRLGSYWDLVLAHKTCVLWMSDFLGVVTKEKVRMD